MKLARIHMPGLVPAGRYWNNKKNVMNLYVKSRTREAWQGKLDTQLRAMGIPSGARVLDIGGGTGTHAIPLAKSGCDVTVIEPSEAMREILQANLSCVPEGQVKVIPSQWEEIALEELGTPFDVVIASYSLAMVDIGEALEKMHACSRGAVHLFWFLTPPAWERVSGDLWPLLHGETYHGEPLADCLWQVLHEMGIHARLTTERKAETVYADPGEAVLEYCQRLNCTTAAQQEVLKAYFASVLQARNNGFTLGGASYSAHISWNPPNQ
ncbi:MAG: class I SAM-dependent methyltransferase [Methanomicrobiales archaeon]|nr:class I SAM-dependent methyltransferase [Methanomicrobiales archaeon]